MFRKIYFILFLIGNIFWQANAQDLGLQMMNNVIQSNKINPAMMTDQKFVFSFPGVTTAIGNSAFAYNDLITVNAEGKNVINGDHFVGLLSDNNDVWTSMDIETLNFSFGGKLWRVFVGHSIRSNAMFSFPKTLAQVALQGNAQFVGQEVNIAPRFQAQAYSEWSVGAAIKLTKLTVGGRIKLLGGIGDVSVAKSKASIYTEDNSIYELTVNSDYEINAAGLVDIQGLDDSNRDTELEILEAAAKDFIWGGNTGVGIDLGATLQVTEKLSVGASIVDMGFIKWKKNSKSYTSQGSYTYKGIDLLDVIEDDSESFENIADTLADIFDFERADKSYTTMTPSRIFLNGSYEISKLFQVGAMISTRHSNGKVNPTFGVMAGMNLGNIFSIGTVISHNNQTKTALGLNGSLKFGPFQIFALTDNIMAAFRPLDHQFTHARFGMNLAFK